MSLKPTIAILLSATSIAALPQARPQKPVEEPAIRISTELVQLDVVVTDKKGKVVSGLSKSDFELYENGKKQQISFFEYVDATRSRQVPGQAKPGEPELSPQGLSAGEVRRIFAFVVDDLTIRIEDLVYLRQMLTNFVDNQMQPSDLVAIVRTVGGKGLLQQFTSDKALLRRAIEALTPRTHPLSQFSNPAAPRVTAVPTPASTGGEGELIELEAVDIAVEPIDVASPHQDTNRALRASMSLGTASFLIESMKQLPGRKSLVLISGGLPILGAQGTEAPAPGVPVVTTPNVEVGAITYFLNVLADDATRAGVAIHTLDLRGLEAYRAVASFEDSPGRSMVSSGTPGNPGGRGDFARVADETLLGRDPTDSHLGLRWLSSATGGVSMLKRNDLEAALGEIVTASDGYYLVAYTPSDAKFNNKFRKIEIKVRGDGLKVYSRRGYFAREDKPVAAPSTRRDDLLAAIHSPLARRDIDLDAMLLYKATQTRDGAIDIHLIINPRKLKFEPAGEKQQTEFEVAGFVFDQLGKLRGGFNETITASLTPDEFRTVSAGGLSYSANTNLPPGVYQVRLAVRDNRTNSIGTRSRYLEIPDLSKGLLGASSLLLGAVPAGDVQAGNPTPITANRQISRKQDMRYAVIIYNPKLKDNTPQVRTQLAISQNGQVLFKEAEETVPAVNLKDGQLLKWGQLKLSAVRPGRYTMTISITDPLADKKAQTLTRTMDFIVVN